MPSTSWCGRSPLSVSTCPSSCISIALSCPHTDGRGGHLKSDQNLIVSYERGNREIVFETPPTRRDGVSAHRARARYEAAKREQIAHPLVLTGAFLVDFLAIHPVADGNGRLARLLTTHELLGQDYRVARYISIEQRIFESKNSYYPRCTNPSAAGIRLSTTSGPGSPTSLPSSPPHMRISRNGSRPLARNPATSANASGSTSSNTPRQFRRRDIERALPGISDATVRLVLAELREEGKIEAQGAGRGARWRRLS